MTALSWADLGERYPDACVYWDRDVAPICDWDVMFVERGSTGITPDGVALFADDLTCPHQRGQWAGPEVCRCRLWTGAEWMTRDAYTKRRQNLGEWAEPQRPFRDRVRDAALRILDRDDLHEYAPLFDAVREPTGDMYPSERQVRREAFRMAERILLLEQRYVPWRISAGAGSLDW